MEFFFNFIRILCELLTFAIFIRVILSWVLTSPNTFTLILDKITEPILSPLRRVIPQVGMFDLTPMVAIILLQLIANLLP